MSKRIRIYGHAVGIAGNRDDSYYAELLDGGTFIEPPLVAMRPHIDADAVCLDVGANIGIYTLAMSMLAPRGVVHAFEPAPQAFKHLTRNLAENSVSNVKAHNVAVGEEAGPVEFRENAEFLAGSFRIEPDSLLGRTLRDEIITVPCTTLDDFVSERGIGRVDFVKIDVEGGELQVLRGARRTLEAHRPAVLLEFGSYSFAVHQGTLPQDALGEILDAFDEVHVVGSDGALSRIASDGDALEFLHRNAIDGPVDNLLCAFAGRPLVDPYGPILAERDWLRETRGRLEEERDWLRGLLGDAEAERDAYGRELRNARTQTLWSMKARLRSLRSRFGAARPGG